MVTSNVADGVWSEPSLLSEARFAQGHCPKGWLGKCERCWKCFGKSDVLQKHIAVRTGQGGS